MTTPNPLNPRKLRKASTVSTFPGRQPPVIPGQLDIWDVLKGEDREREAPPARSALLEGSDDAPTR